MTVVQIAKSRAYHWLCLFILSVCLPFGTLAGDGGRQWLANPPDVPDVRLIDSKQIEHRLRDLLAEQAVVVGFFYTHCSTVCPVQTSTFKALQRRLLARPEKALLISITLDPVNDSASAIQDYATKFKVSLGVDQRWLMLTGDGTALEPLWKAFELDSGPPEQHASALWVGSMRTGRWVRLDGLVSADELLAWLEASAE
jgi:protein SCO1/2